jgi:hypothetical protein
MQIFELHFNPKGKEDKIVDSFIYEPENIYEKRLGNLYLVGELTNCLPQNSHFLSNLAAAIKKEYYSSGLKKSCEISLRDSLKKGNEFLDGQSREGDVSWLGNLNLVVLNLKEFVLNFTKVGKMKILLARNGEIVDISQKLEGEDIEPYPLKVFGNIASGKLSPDDKLIVLTPDVFSTVSSDKDFLKQLSKISDKKELKEILKTKKQILSEISGICLLLIAGDGLPEPETITLRKQLPKFSFKKTLFKPFLRLKPSFKTPKVSFRIPRVRLKVPKVKLTLPRHAKRLKTSPKTKKKLILVLILILVLAIGFLVFR